AGKDEEGDRQERKDVHARRHLLETDGQRQAFVEQCRKRRQADRKRHWHAEHEQPEETRRENAERYGHDQAGSTSSPLARAITCSIENSTTSTPDIAAGTYFHPSEIHNVGRR